MATHTPVASTSRLPHPTTPSPQRKAKSPESSPAGSTGPPRLPPSILKPADKQQLSRPYYFYHGDKRVKARIDPEVPLPEVVKQLVRSSQLALDSFEAVPESFDLFKSATVEAKETIRKLASKDPATLKQTTFSLRNALAEESFRRAFLRADGLPALQAIIRRGSGNTLAYALNSLHVLLETDGPALSFDSLFLARIVDIVALETLVNVTRPATAGLCSLARLSRTPAAGARARTFPTLVDIILRQTRLFPTLIERISASDLEVADSSIELLDQLLLGSVDTADSRIPDELESLEVWRAIAKTLESNVGATATKYNSLERSLAKYLSASASLPILEEHYHLFDEIWLASQLDDVDETNRWRRLGFTTEAPQYEFDTVGLLGLKTLKRYAEDSQNEFAETLRVYETGGARRDRIPLSTISNIVLRLLLDHLVPAQTVGSGSTPSTSYLFRFNECHALGVQCFQHLWEDSQSGVQDLERLTRMTKSQIVMVLDQDSGKSWFRVRQEFAGATYAAIRDRQLRDLASDHALLATPKSQAIKARLYAEAYERVSRQRIAAMEAGAWFRLADSSTASNGKPESPRPRDPSEIAWRFYRLSADHRSLHWADSPDINSHKIAIGALPASISTDRITGVKPTPTVESSGASSPVNAPEPSPSALDSVRRRFSVLQRSLPSRPSVDRRLSVEPALSFVVTFAGAEPVHVIAPDPTAYANWLDGLSLLRPDGTIVSRSTLKHIESLADMGTRIKLLDLQDEAGGLLESLLPATENGV
ncbi:hypothetical protein JCM8202v2_004213 [Rhodotorula sphaerocarpa]